MRALFERCKPEGKAMIRRRWLVSAWMLCSVITLSAAAQPRATVDLPRVVIVTSGDEAGHGPFRDHFLKSMRAAGQVEGHTYRLDILYANRDTTRTRGLIGEAVAGQPAVLMVYGLTSARYARDATTTVPVVVATASDMVDAGLVKSFARPGGNITGINDLSDELAAKRLELIRDAMPKATRVVLLVNPNFPATPKIERRVGEAARALGIKITRLDAKDPASLNEALDSLQGSRYDALLLGGDALFVVRAKELIARANAMRIPVIHYWPGTAEMGALMSHQADIFYNVERAAVYVGRILKGANPGDLPIEQPTRYELLVNMKTAKAFGLTMPPEIMVRATKVIQ
jgi:putative ABC transport system substrate-binding protein